MYIIKRKFAIRTIWNGLILLIMLFPVVALLPWLSTRLYTMQLENYLATQKQFNLAIKDRLDLEIKRLETLLRNKSDPMAYTLSRNVDRALLQNLLNAVLNREPAVRSLYVVNRHGKLLAQLNRHEPLAGRSVDKNSAERGHHFPLDPENPEIRSALHGSVFFGPLDRYSHNGMQQFPIAVPIGLGAHPVGVLVAKISPQNLWEGVYPYINQPGVFTYIVDKHGNLVATPSGEEYQIGSETTQVPIINALIKGKEWDSRKTYTGFTGVISFGVATQISSLNWRIISEIPEQLVTYPIYKLLGIMAGVSLIVAILAGSLGLLSVGRLLKPIKQLNQAFVLIGKGDYTQQLPPSAIKEFDQLAKGFSSMLKEFSTYQHKIHESEKHYRELVETANVIPWRLDLTTWRFTYVGPQAVKLLGYPLQDWYADDFWTNHLHPDDREQTAKFCLEYATRCEDHEFEYRMVAADGQAIWVRNNINVVLGEYDTKILRGFLFDITERKQVEKELHRHREHLEELVVERTTKLEAANKELEAFSYSVSHDLRTPLRSIDGFSLALLEDYEDKLDETGKDHLQRVRAASQRMGELIDDMLMLSRVSRTEMRQEHIDLSALAHEVSSQLQNNQPERQVKFCIQEGLSHRGDANLLRIVLDNLLGNAWKFTQNQPKALIEFGYTKPDNQGVYYVRDNGVGFDMQYANKLFGAFQRLHSMQEFEGTGIGLVTVQRIIHRHGGQVWAEADENKGATFYFTMRDATNGTKNHTISGG